MTGQDTNPLHAEHRTRTNTVTPASIADHIAPRTITGAPWTDTLDTTTRARLAELASTARTTTPTGMTRPTNGDTP